VSLAPTPELSRLESAAEGVDSGGPNVRNVEIIRHTVTGSIIDQRAGDRLESELRYQTC
jgi:hypothetical protein